MTREQLRAYYRWFAVAVVCCAVTLGLGFATGNLWQQRLGFFLVGLNVGVFMMIRVYRG